MFPRLLLKGTNNDVQKPKPPEVAKQKLTAELRENEVTVECFLTVQELSVNKLWCYFYSAIKSRINSGLIFWKFLCGFWHMFILIKWLVKRPQEAQNTSSKCVCDGSITAGSQVRRLHIIIYGTWAEVSLAIHQNASRN